MMIKRTYRTIGTGLTALILVLSLIFSTGFAVVKAQETEADLYEPEAVMLVTTEQNVVPNAEDGIENSGALPADAIFEWNDETIFGTVTDLITGSIIVTYADASEDEVPVDVAVTAPTTDAEIYSPYAAVEAVVTEVGVVPGARAAIVNAGELPEGTQFTWDNLSVFETALAATFANVHLTYPDGSTEFVPVPLTILAPETDAELYNPYAAVEALVTEVGVIPEVIDGIANFEEMPDGTSYEWESTVVFQTVAAATFANVFVNYPDGSSDTVTVPLAVVEEVTPETDAELYQPRVVDLVTTEVGVVPLAEDAVINLDEMPEETIFSWQDDAVFDEVKTEINENLIASYPDGTEDMVPVLVTVTEAGEPEETDAVLYQPEVVESLTTMVGVVPSAREAVTNLADLPEGTTFSWQDDAVFDEVKTEINENLIALYPDGSEDMVPVLVTVTEKEPTDADRFTPVATDLITTEVGVVPEAIDGIANFEEMPEGTIYAWENETVFNQVIAATHGYVVVTYPDGSRDVVPVPVTVVEDLTPEPDADLYNPIAVTLLTTEVGVVPDAHDGIENLNELPADATFTWEDETVFHTVMAATYATVVITYGDGSVDRVPVPVTVTEPIEQTHANVTVRFVDLDGNQIMPARITSREIGSTYLINRVAIEGYQLDSVVGEETGIVSINERENIVTYVYRKIPDVSKETGTTEAQLPATGESSPWIITGIAAVLILAGGGILYSRYRKKE